MFRSVQHEPAPHDNRSFASYLSRWASAVDSLADVSFYDCEGETETEHSREASATKTRFRKKKYAVVLFITMALGAAGGMSGFFVLAPTITEDGMAGDGIVAASRGDSRGKVKRYVADIEHRVAKMSNTELAGLFSTLQNDMCDDSMKPRVANMLKNPRTKAQLDAMLANPSFLEDVMNMADQSPEKGALRPLKALGKLSSVAPLAGTRAAQAGDFSAKMGVTSDMARSSIVDDLPSGMAEALMMSSATFTTTPSESRHKHAITAGGMGAGAVGMGILAAAQLLDEPFPHLPPALTLCLLVTYGSTYSNSLDKAVQQVGHSSAKLRGKGIARNEEDDLLAKISALATAIVAGISGPSQFYVARA